MEPDTTLLLNLVAKPSEKTNSNPKIDKRLRKRKRKDLTGDPVDEAKFSLQTSKKKRPELESREPTVIPRSMSKATTGNPRTSKGSRVISSIFRKNPKIELPNVDTDDVKPNYENLFSSTRFSELPIHPRLSSCLENMSFVTMTEVQRKAIPRLLNGSDCLIKSQTGSGKTLCYAVPLLQHLREIPSLNRSTGVLSVILLPTRELAQQTYATISKLVQSSIWIVPGILIGGVKMNAEKNRIRKGLTILIATPGRLVYHIKNTKSLNIRNIHSLVIDEADRLLDMGFEKEVNQILAEITADGGGYSKRQTVLLSATLSTRVKSLAAVTLKNPVTVDIAVKGDQLSKEDPRGDSRTVSKAEDQSDSEEIYTLPNSLKQYYVIAPNKLRLVTLASLILAKCQHSTKAHKMIVFLPSQDIVQFYFELLNSTINNRNSYGENEPDEENEDTKTRFEMYALHGEMKQEFRTAVYESFISCSSGVLLCTDVASRGLDLPNVDWVVQYLPPHDPESYIHRVGRTARIGHGGSALLFLMPSEVKFIHLLQVKNIRLQAISVESILDTCLQEADRLALRSNKSSHSSKTSFNREQAASALQQALDVWTNHDSSRLEKAKQAFQSFVGAYSTYPTKLKHMFHVKQLHLGHLAKSFCLHEAPTLMRGIPLTLSQQKKMKYSEVPTEQKRKTKKVDMSEFASGF